MAHSADRACPLYFPPVPPCTAKPSRAHDPVLALCWRPVLFIAMLEYSGKTQPAGDMIMSCQAVAHRKSESPSRLPLRPRRVTTCEPAMAHLDANKPA